MPVNCKKCETYFRVTIVQEENSTNFHPISRKNCSHESMNILLQAKKMGLPCFLKNGEEKGENFGLKKESLNYRTSYHKISRERREFQQ